VNAVSPAIESGHVHLPTGEAWVSAFVDQFTAFPAGKNDDMVDCATQALSYMIYASGELAALPEHGQDESGYEDLADAMLDGDACYDVYGSGY
jgi:hypothetical protein